MRRRRHLLVPTSVLASLAIVAACSGNDQQGSDSIQSAHVELDLFRADGTFSGKCSGVLLSPTRVLTAGHCVVGKARWKAVSPGAQASAVGSKAYAYDWVPTTKSQPKLHDLAVVMLDSPIMLKEYPTFAAKGVDTTSAVRMHRVNGQFESISTSISSAKNVGFAYHYAMTMSANETLDTGGAVMTPDGREILGIVYGLGTTTKTLFATRTDTVAGWLTGRVKCTNKMGPVNTTVACYKSDAGICLEHGPDCPNSHRDAEAARGDGGNTGTGTGTGTGGGTGTGTGGNGGNGGIDTGSSSSGAPGTQTGSGLGSGTNNGSLGGPCDLGNPSQSGVCYGSCGGLATGGGNGAGSNSFGAPGTQVGGGTGIGSGGSGSSGNGGTGAGSGTGGSGLGAGTGSSDGTGTGTGGAGGTGAGSSSFGSPGTMPGGGFGFGGGGAPSGFGIGAGFGNAGDGVGSAIGSGDGTGTGSSGGLGTGSATGSGAGTGTGGAVGAGSGSGSGALGSGTGSGDGTGTGGAGGTGAGSSTGQAAGINPNGGAGTGISAQGGCLGVAYCQDEFVDFGAECMCGGLSATTPSQIK